MEPVPVPTELVRTCWPGRGGEGHRARGLRAPVADQPRGRLGHVDLRRGELGRGRGASRLGAGAPPRGCCRRRAGRPPRSCPTWSAARASCTDDRRAGVAGGAVLDQTLACRPSTVPPGPRSSRPAAPKVAVVEFTVRNSSRVSPAWTRAGTVTVWVVRLPVRARGGDEADARLRGLDRLGHGAGAALVVGDGQRDVTGAGGGVGVVAGLPVPVVPSPKSQA